MVSIYGEHWSLMGSYAAKYCRHGLVFISVLCVGFYSIKSYPAGIHLFKVDNGNTRTMCKIRLNLTTKTAEGCQ